MKYLPTLVIFLSTLIACENYATNEFTDIVSKKTKNHINIPGTRVFMIPPEGFEVAFGFTGLIRSEGGTIVITDSIGKIFTLPKREEITVPIEDFKYIKVNGYDGAFFTLPNFELDNILVFGDSTFNVSISAGTNNSSVSIESIRKSLRTIYYDKEQEVIEKKIDLDEPAVYSIDDSNSQFKLTSSWNGNMFVFTKNGVQKDEYRLSDNAIVSAKSNDKPSDYPSIFKAHINVLEQAGFRNVKMKNSPVEKINNLTISESEITGELGDSINALLYLAFVTNGENTVFLQGSVIEDLESNLREFKKLSRSVTFNE